MVDVTTGLMPEQTTDDFDKIKPLKVGVADDIGREVRSEEVRKTNEANTVVKEGTGLDIIPDSAYLFADTLERSFKSGSNFGYQVFKRAEREWLAPAPDPSYDANAFIKKYEVPANYQMQFHLAGSDAEAQSILGDIREHIANQDVISRRTGISPFVANLLAGVVDIDTPLSVLSGGLTSELKMGGILATKWGRMAAAGTSGALTQGVAATLGVEASTTDDWTSIPAAALGGFAFGTLGGMKAHTPEMKANEAARSAAHAFDEDVAMGSPLAQRDIRSEVHVNEDPYGSKAAQEAHAARMDAPVVKDAEGRIAPAEAVSHMSEDEKAELAAAVRAHVLAENPEGNQSNGGRKPAVFRMDEVEVIPDSIGESGSHIGSEITGEAGSIGARQMNASGSTANVVSERSRTILNNATKRDQKLGISNDYFEKASNLQGKGTVADAVHAAAVRFHDVLAASPIATDFDRFMKSGSTIAKVLTYDLMESASGILRNNRSAAMLKDHYEKQLLGTFMPAYEDGYAAWAKSQGMSWYDRITNNAKRDEFNNLVVHELNARAYDPPGTSRATDAAVKHVADAHDAWSKLEVEIGKGRPNEGSIKGYENITPYSGYFGQKWSGAKIEKLIASGKTEKDIADAVAEAYVTKHGFDPADAKVWAAAVVRRARHSEQGTDMNLIGILQQDGRKFLRDVLTDNNISAHDAEKLIDTLTGQAAVRGQASHTKGRIDVDLRYTASNGVKLIDLVNTDIARMVASRSRGSSGAAALARKGILSRMDRADIKQAILDEQLARGKSVGATAPGPTASIGERLRGVRDKFSDALDRDKHLTGEDIDTMFSYFDAGPVGGRGKDANELSRMSWIANAKKLTNLALLNTLGLTQMAEVGVQMSSVGLKRWFSHAGDAIRGNALNPRSKLTEELRHMHVMVPEERLFRDDLNVDMERTGPGSSDFAQRVSNMLNTGQRLQGYTSGFYAVRNFQQRVAVTSAADKIMRNMAGHATDLSAARAADIGFTPQLWKRIQKYATVPNGKKKRKTPIVDFDKDGNLVRLNLHKWDPKDVEDFALTLNRHVNQVVQKAMIGESTALFHKDGIASLFFHLKSFTLLAAEKQAYRNLRHADAESLHGFIAGLATAAAAYSTKQALSGNTQNLSIGKIADGAINYSNMTGWLPMWVDPIATMLGMDSLKFNTFNRGVDSGIFGVPAVFPTMNKIAHLPAVATHAVTGNFSNSDVNAMKAAPLMGNYYGMGILLNALKSERK